MKANMLKLVFSCTCDQPFTEDKRFSKQGESEGPGQGQAG